MDEFPNGGTELPGGYPVDFVSNGKHETVFVYLRERLRGQDKERLRSRLLAIRGISAVGFGVLQRFGFRTDPDGC